MNFASKSTRQLLTLFDAIVLGIAISVILFFAIRKLEKQNAQTTFDRLAEERVDRLEGNIALNLNDIVSLGSYFDVKQSVTRQEFFRLTAPLLANNNAIQALEWAPDVPNKLRRNFEDAARRDNLAVFQFTERLSDGRMAGAAVRRNYAPVYFVEPFRGNEKALGFDLLSSENAAGDDETLNRQWQTWRDQPDQACAGDRGSVRSTDFPPCVPNRRADIERAGAARGSKRIRARSDSSWRPR